MDAKRAATHAQQEKLNAELAALGAPKTKKPKAPVPKASSPKPPPPTAPHTDVQGHVTDYIKLHFYRNKKFVCNEEHEKRICLAVWNHLHKKHSWEAKYNLDLGSFTKIYASTIRTALSGQRQYSQTKGKSLSESK